MRVVTYHTDRSVTLAQRIDTDLLAWDADLIVVQDCAPEVGAAMMAAPPGRAPYQVFLESEFCVATRLPTF